MVGVDASFKVLAALASLAFGLLVLAAGPRRVPHQALFVFLLLIAGNQAAEALRTAALTEADRLFWRRLASVFAGLDPVALYYFASVYPERNELNRTPRVAAVLAGGASMSLVGGWLLPTEGTPSDGAYFYSLALTVYTAAVYSFVLQWAFRRLQRDAAQAWWRILFVAACVATLPLWAQVGSLGIHGYIIHFRPPNDASIPLLWSTFLAVTLAAGAFLLRGLLRRLPPEASGAAWTGVGVSAALFFGAHLAAPIEAVALLLGQPYPQVPYLGRGLATARWLLFGLLVSVAVLRHGSPAMSLRARRRAARALVALAFLSAGTFLAAFAIGGAGIPPWALVAIGLAVLLSQGFRSLVDEAAWRAYGVPPEGAAGERLEAYRIAVVRQLAQGRPLDDPDMRRLRAELGLDDAVADVVESAAEAGRGPLAEGQLVARRYRVRSLLGQGGQGRVFLARDERVARDVVLKEILLDAPEQADVALREARLAGGVGHPHVVTLYDALLRPDAVVLVAEHVPGGSLKERVAQRGRLDEAEGARVLLGVLRGLAEIHRRGVVHRDLKPANVLLTREGEAKIGDFGLARLAEGDTTRTGGGWGLAGTLSFMAPEQRRGDPGTFRTDVHAVGLLARACLPEPLPPAVEAVVAEALREDPAERWADAGEMLAALERALAAPHAQ